LFTKEALLDKQPCPTKYCFPFLLFFLRVVVPPVKLVSLFIYMNFTGQALHEGGFSRKIKKPLEDSIKNKKMGGDPAPLFGR